MDHTNSILLSALTVATRLLRCNDWCNEIEEIFATLGQAAAVSRVYLFENHVAADGALLTSQRYEWAAEGVEPQINLPELQNFPLVQGGFGRWVDILEGNRPVCGHVRDFPLPEQAVLEAQGILSILVVPVFVEEQWWGFIGFDECFVEREWNPAEINALQMTAEALGAAIERQRREQQTNAVVALGNALGSVGSSVEMPAVILEQVLKLLDGDGAALALYEPYNEDTVVLFGRGVWEQWNGKRLKIPASFLQKAQLDNRLLEQLQLPNPCRSVACVPLRSEGTLIGVLWLGRCTSPTQSVFSITTDEIKLMQALANVAASAIVRSRLHERLQEKIKWLEMVHQLDIAIGSLMDLRPTLNLLVSQVLLYLKADAAAVALFNPALNHLEFVAAQGLMNNVVGRLFLKLGQSLAGQIALSQKMLYVADLRQMTEEALGSVLRAEGFITYFGFPLIAKGELKGVLEILYKSPLDHVGPDWLDFCQLLAEQAAIAIENAQLFEKLQRSNLELSFLHDQMIELLARALELRDRETEGHSQRVTMLTLQLAKALQVPEDELVHIRRGAILHDIGKMGVPDSVLLKPTSLDEAERSVIRQHPQYALHLLAPILPLRRALDIPYCHHERWDGSGYPRGLKGEEIPLSARIFAVVDVWDALNSDRPYRPAWKREQVIAYLRQESGRQFDPRVVEAFLRLVDEGLVPPAE